MIFNKALQKKYPMKNACIYELGAEIIKDCLIRKNIATTDDLLLYGYYGKNIANFDMYSNISGSSLLPAHHHYDDNNIIKLPYCDEEDLNSIIEKKFDIAISNMSLHFCNDVVKTIAHYNNFLKKEGLFISTILGGNSLHELREAYHHIDTEMYGGAFQRVYPMLTSQSMMNIMNKAGFAYTVVHTEKFFSQHSSIFLMLKDLRDMGFGNFLHRISLNSQPITKDFLSRVEVYYRKNYADGNLLHLTYEIIVCSGFHSPPTNKE